MDTTPICPGCGKPLAANAPKGLCQECLLKAAFPTGTQTGGKAPPFNAPAVEELADKFPQLEILELIGSGGMGAVYRVRQKELDRIVALKILPPDISQDPAFAERFTREARALAKLNHPGIVTIYDFGRADGLFFFLMEFVDGVNLRRLLQGGRLSSREALAIVPQICDALQYAHDQGIVHRDIKPENVLLDRQGRVKVADFGLAKIIAANGGRDETSEEEGQGAQTAATGDLTEAGRVMGTPLYMAPEQLAHPAEVDHRADIYALGVVLYQMLTGELPGKRIEPPSAKVQIDVRLDEVVLRALEKEPARRYQQASVLKTDVETIVTQPQPLSFPAMAESRSPRLPARSGWQPVIAGLLLAASIVLWGIIGYWAYVQPLIIDRLGARATPLSTVQLWIFQAGSVVHHYSLLLVPMLVLLTAGSFIWLIVSSIRPTQSSRHVTPSDRGGGGAVRKASVFGIASLCFVFGAMIWGGRALRTYLLGFDSFIWQRLHGRGEWDAVIAFLSLFAAFGFGLASRRQLRVARGTELEPSANSDGSSASKAVLVARWMARIFGTLLLIFYGTFILAEGLPPIASQPGGVQLNFVALGLMVGGFIVGWKREGTAALLIASGWTLWQISENHIGWNLFQTPLPVAGLYAFCWWASGRRRTGALAAALAALALALVLGRLFVPTSVFVRGVVTDSLSGQPVADAELTLVPRAAHLGNSESRPNARSGRDGRFRLYVGWYREGQQVGLSATGYSALTTNLGPRELGQRNVSRNFRLSPTTKSQPDRGRAEMTDNKGWHAAPSVTPPPVVVSTVPRSGASDVDPALTELRVTFSKPMHYGSWSWVKLDDATFPEMMGDPRYLSDRRTCVLPVKLQPGRVYATWINMDSLQDFQDEAGQPAVPYLLVFETNK